MRWSLIAVRVSIVVVTIIAALIILLSTVPLATGGLEFDFPEDNEDIWQMQGRTITAEMPIGIYNGGYFDIEDFSLFMNLTDDDGYPLVDVWTDPTDLTAGDWTEIIVRMSFDLDDLPAEKQFEIVFNGTEAFLNIGLDSYFGLRTMRVSITIDDDENTIDIPPMITEMNIDQSQVQLVPTSEGYDLVIPYSFSASDMVVGDELTLFLTVRNETTTFGSVTEQITVQQMNQGQLRFPLSNETYLHLQSLADTLIFETAITFQGIVMEREFTYQWSPFIDNLQVQGIYPYYIGADGQIDVQYSFDAAQSLQGTEVSCVVTISDDFGQIASGTDYIFLQQYNSRYVTLYAPADAMARVYGTPATWTITFDIMGPGIITTMSTTYYWNGGV